MEQIYYTQCPIGYGLGASNGYQVKRISAGYPATADFRHLGLRAFLPGSRAMSPPALRYRRDGDVAEVAWLTPRDREFETERGRWGRPGGHFAHGLRLDRAEFERISVWPAGLYDSPVWKRGDPEATRGRPPDPIDLDPESLTPAPEIGEVAKGAEGLDRRFLATLLEATARAAREGRTLYLIGEASRLPGLIGLLTFAFPPLLRADLTFSTYHDRPEELVGFRVQGTTPGCRPNRAMLAASGFVADLESGCIDPPMSPPIWAMTLARYVSEPDTENEAAFNEMTRRAARARIADGESPWDEGWLGPLVEIQGAIADASATPESPAGWAALERLASWSGGAGLAAEWVAARPPGWWEARASASEVPEARTAFRSSVRWPGSWSAADPLSWGAALAAWFGRREARERHEAIAEAWRVLPPAARPGFLSSLLGDLTPRTAEATMAGLRDLPDFDRRLLVPLEARQAARAAIEREDLAPLRGLFSRVAARAGSMAAPLEAISAEAAARPEAVTLLARGLASFHEMQAGGVHPEFLRWALAREERVEPWLGPSLQRLFATGDADARDSLRDRVPEAARPTLARVAVEVARGPGLPAEPFLWAVENLLLPIDEARRPAHPAWAEAYLRRTDSELVLISKLYSGEVEGLKRWIYEARDRGEVSSEQSERIDRVRTFTRVLQAGDADALLGVALPAVPPKERGQLLARMLEHLDAESLAVCLDCCRSAWPGGFLPGADGLAEVAGPIADLLAAQRQDPHRWFEALESILRCLGLLGASLDGFEGYEPDGLAAEVLAATSRIRGDGAAIWRLREEALRDDRRWRILAADARIDLEGVLPTMACDRYREWGDRIDQGRFTSRLAEVLLNVCNGPGLAAVVERNAESLTTQGPLPWWASPGFAGSADDLREAYCRLAPMDPVRFPACSIIGRWLREAFRESRQEAEEASDLVPEEEDLPLRNREIPRASSVAESRWRCLSALSEFHMDGRDLASRMQLVGGWIASGLPIHSLDGDDASRFVSWVIAGLDPEATGRVERLGAWLAKAGNVDADRVRRWSDGMPPEVQGEAAARVAVVSELWRAIHVERRERREALRKDRPGGSP